MGSKPQLWLLNSLHDLDLLVCWGPHLHCLLYVGRTYDGASALVTPELGEFT